MQHSFMQCSIRVSIPHLRNSKPSFFLESTPTKIWNTQSKFLRKQCMPLNERRGHSHQTAQPAREVEI
ncbi:uncharacterized protein METZ01_LOCUS124922 [marine metagenome]|uniref:Uncharacterized protein n=1 Tax=marine metagenome TaxID=408172 RepID=A0A381Y4W8_9ZZZZ